MRLCILSTQHEPCGIADYSENLRSAMSEIGTETAIHPIDVRALRKRARGELSGHFDGFIQGLNRFDSFIIQHEFGLYAGSYGAAESNVVFQHILLALEASHKPALIIFHSAPPGWGLARILRQWWKRRKEARPQSAGALAGTVGIALLRWLRARPSWLQVLRLINVNPHLRAVVHTHEARRAMIDSGLGTDKLAIIRHGVSPMAPLDTIRLAANGNPSTDVYMTMFGFVAAYKGYEVALRSLLLLPPSFKLIIAGGQHPATPQDRTLEHILTFLKTGDYPSGSLAPLPAAERAAACQQLAGRVEITGYLKGSDIQRVLDRTSIVLAPYSSDGPQASGALARVLTSRLPVVATKIPAFMEMNEISTCLLLVSENAPHELADAILRLSRDDRLKADLPLAGAQYAEICSWSKFARQAQAQLESLAKSFNGVVNTYAIQAGREIRVICNHELLDDAAADQLSHEIANKIQQEMEYPGQIKVTVIREFRSITMAK